MSIREKIGLFIVGVLGCTLLLQRFNRPTPFKGPAQISYQRDTIVVQQTGKPDFKEFQPDPKSTVITTDKLGHVTIRVRQFGVGTDLGVGLGFSDRARVALDDRFAYFKRFGANVGLGFSLDKKDYTGGYLLDMVDPYVGLSYVPSTHLSNTMVVAAITVDKHLFIFARLRF